MKILLTGATGKVGKHFIPSFLASHSNGAIRACICWNDQRKVWYPG